MLLQITINSYYIKKNHTYIDNYKFIMYINILMTLIVNYIYNCIWTILYICVFVSGRIGSDIRTFGSDRIQVSGWIRLNPYPIHIHSKNRILSISISIIQSTDFSTV